MYSILGSYLRSVGFKDSMYEVEGFILELYKLIVVFVSNFGVCMWLGILEN